MGERGKKPIRKRNIPAYAPIRAASAIQHPKVVKKPTPAALNVSQIQK
jgi:hypothetical protein